MTGNKKDKREDQPDPITFMRSRHPDLYSDSGPVSKSQLTEDILDHRLETLTNRSEENDFAVFARRLAQKEICPNLRPQTGPVGGGDSKVDGETIPVSSDVSDIWVGIDPAAAQERWAFAFSAKKDWKSKVAQDVAKIAGTNRGYTRIYFVTNQFAPDKSRAQSEDALSKKFGIPVVILDRSWILKAIFENGRQDLAIEALHIESLRVLTDRKVGPADRERQEELDELEKGIADPALYAGAQYQLFEDCLQAALLARGLGRPKTEMDGLFIRAQRIAEKADDDKLRLRVAYNYAWTVIFWFDDYNQLNQMYDMVAPLACKSNLAEEVELAVNLLMVLSAQVGRGVLSEEDAKLEERKAVVAARLDELVADGTRPNNALQAKTIRTLLDLHDAIARQDEAAVDAVWTTIQSIVQESGPLGDYPFDRLVGLVNEFAELGVESEEFDKLFELVVANLEKRRGEASGAELLSDRGYKKLEAGHPYEAISLLGRAMERFIKREHREDLIFCLMGLSQAYYEAGLLWAARSCALAATERCFAYFHEQGTLVRRSRLCLGQLVTMELLLGRIPNLLMALELENVLMPQLMLKDEALRRAQSSRHLTEGMLGILFLTASLQQLKRMEGMPAALAQMDLTISEGFLLYALGYKSELVDEGFPSGEEADAFMKRAYEQPGRLQMPDRPQIDDGQYVDYKTNVLGCEVQLRAEANAYSISVAEAVLGSLEAFFATSLGERIMPYKQSVRIILRSKPDLAKGLEIFEETQGSETHLVVQHPPSAPEATPEQRMADRNGLMEVIGRFMAQVTVIDNIEAYLEKVAGEERGFARALVYSESSLAQANLFGKAPKVLVQDWKAEGEAKIYPLVRTTEWTDGVEFNQIPLPSSEEEGELEGKSSEEIRVQLKKSMETGKHSQRQVVSLIDVPLWNQATWRGTLFGFIPGDGGLPILGLGFENREAAQKIFQGLISKVGQVDAENRLRVLLIRGVTKSNPAAYRVVIGTKVDPSPKGGKTMMMVTRNHTMEPTSTENLDRFLAGLADPPNYLLAPAHYNPEQGGQSLGMDLAIHKTELVVRNAWEIGPNDIDMTGLAPDDDPVVPEGVENPPCKEALALLRSMKA